MTDTDTARLDVLVRQRARELLADAIGNPDEWRSPAEWAAAVVTLDVAETLDHFADVIEALDPLIRKYTDNPAARFAARATRRKDR